MTVTSETLTLEQFMELPEEKPPLEYFEGSVAAKMSPKLQHSALQSELVQRINRYAQPGKLARAFTELRTTFAGASCVPDVAVYRWERIPRDSSGELVNDVFEPPDAAIEIVSPGQSTSSVVRRCLWYVEHGVQLALAVDPADKSVLVIRPDGRINACHAGNRIELAELLPEFELTAEDLFACLR